MGDSEEGVIAKHGITLGRVLYIVCGGRWQQSWAAIMFWRLGFAQSSPIDTLLDSDSYTLQQLMDEDDLVQECKQLNNKLLD